MRGPLVLTLSAAGWMEPQSPMEIDNAAYGLCEEVRDGLWDEQLKTTRNGQPAACEAIIAELRRRCPGHSKGQYESAIAKGMFASR